MTAIEVFQAFRRILCVCPCCGDIVRLSDLRLQYAGKTQKTWYDELADKRAAIERKTEKFAEKEADVRAKATEKGRKEAQEAMGRLIDTTFKKLHIDPYDLKPIMHPVDFVAFEGLKADTNVRRISFLSKPVKNPNLNLLREQVKKAVADRQYEWKTVRMTEEGKVEIG